MAIEIDAKPRDRNFPQAVVFLLASIGIFLFFIISFFFFENRISAYELQIKENEKQLIPATDEKDLEKKIKGYESKISGFTQAISMRKKANDLFAIFEKNSHPNVYIKNITWDELKPEVSVEAVSSDLKSFAQQIMIWKNTKEIQNIKLSTLTKGETGYVFTALLSFGGQAF